MAKKSSFKKKPIKMGKRGSPPRKKIKRGKKKLGYRTPDRFKRLISRRKPDVTARPRSLGGHR